MRRFDSEMTRMLTSGVTSLCHCWKLTLKPRPGIADRIQGFTDHDQPLIFDGLSYEAVSGFTSSVIESGLGLKIDNLEVEGALSSRALNESDIIKGLYDDARIDIYRVNWRDVSQRILLRSGHIGEIRRTSWGFSAELRGLAHKLSQPAGRLYQHLCDADLGDDRCKVGLSNHRHSAIVFSADGDNRVITVRNQLTSFQEGWFAGGKLVFTSGKNQGHGFDVRHHLKKRNTVKLELWHAATQAIAANDQFTVLPGCNKTFGVCRTKFGNQKNFQGFPHIPGNDFVQYYPRS